MSDRTVSVVVGPGYGSDRQSAETLRPWLRHLVWCNCKTDDPPSTERCKCGLRQALAATPPAPALDVERLARAIDSTPALVYWRVDKGDRFEAVKVWAADIAREYAAPEQPEYPDDP